MGGPSQQRVATRPTALVSAAAINRMVSGTLEVHGLQVLLISSVVGLVMVVGALILRGDDDDDDQGGQLNMRAVLLDTTADAAAAIAVALSGAIILATVPTTGSTPPSPYRVSSYRLPRH